MVFFVVFYKLYYILNFTAKHSKINVWAKQAIEQLEVTQKNRILYHMIPNVIQPEDYLKQLHSMLDVVVVKKKRILDFPSFELEKERQFPTVAAAIVTFRQWINEIRE